VNRSCDPLEIKIDFCADAPGQIRECAILIYSATGLRVAVLDLRESEFFPFRYERSRFRIVTYIESLPLVDGDFTLGLYIVSDQFAGNILELADFSVVLPQSTREFAPYPAGVRGIVALNAATSIVTDRLPVLT